MVTFCNKSTINRALPFSAYSVVQASVMYVMVNIQNTYVWIAPENRSKYTCSAAGHTMAIFESRPYTRAVITVPDKTFANKRSDNETGTAISPMTLIGAQIGHGSQRPEITPLTFWYLNLLKWINVNVMIPIANVTP